MKHHQKVLSHALAGHGSWSKALIAHGIKPPGKRYRLHLLVRLRNAIESGAKFTKAFSWELEYYFGSVEKAGLKLKRDKRILNGWSPKRVILQVQERHRQKLGLAYNAARVEFPSLSAPPKRISAVGDAL
jgi:hypothetical protein